MSNKFRIYYRPESSAVTLAAAKAHLRVDHSDEDYMIQSMMRAATLAAEQYADRLFMLARIEQYFDSFPGSHPIRLYYPASTIVDIQYQDEDGQEQTLDTAEYILDQFKKRGEIHAITSFPGTKDIVNAVKVRYETGMCGDPDSIPPDIRHAILLQLGRMYEYREDSVSVLPVASQRLLDPYRITFL